jgi:hypothetical protein
MLRLAPLLLPLLLTAGSDEKPDTVVLKSGKEIECRVLFEDDSKVAYRESGRRVKEVAREEVAEVHSIEGYMRTFLARFAALDRSDVAALSDLALWAESVDLHGEARNLWIRVLTLDPENEQAWTELGGSKGRKGWRLRVRGRYKTLEELRERVADWKTAMELPTAHYLIRTNADPRLALDAAIDVERIHQMYYDTVGRALELYPFEETPELHVYAATDDAPRPPQPGWSAWYERIGNTVMVRGLDAPPHEIRKAFVYMLLTNSFRLPEANHEGQLPEWAREGIANAFAFALRPSPGAVEMETGVPHVEWFAQQAADPEPLPIKRVIDGGRGAFRTGDDEARYVRQSYTLAFFLLNHEGGKYRGKFLEYMKSAFGGKGAASHFEKIFGVEFGDLDREYAAFVRRIAGA